MKRKVVAVLFGGQSSEHEISCLSAATVVRAIDADRYETLLIGITREGRWLQVDSLEAITSGEWRSGRVSAILSPDAGMKAVLMCDGEKLTLRPVDVVFPVLHGRWGEDGTVQGLLELACLPYVGCGVLASAVSMDKLYTKIIVDRLGITQASYQAVEKPELAKDADGVMDRLERTISYPMVVQPADAGSSKGVSKAETRGELLAALQLAAAEGTRVLVEETIVGRELECAVLTTPEGTKASGVGEIIAAAEFYDFDAKYNNADSKTTVRPELPDDVREEIRRAAVRIFDGVSGFGLARVDFFMEKGTNRMIFNELNTLPGFTSISMYPMLWREQGLDTRELVTALIESAFDRG